MQYWAKLRILICCAINIASICCYGQEEKPIHFTYFNHSSGFKIENINSIIEDNRGFLWLGGNEGLHRFDGHNVKSFYANLNDTDKFQSNEISILGKFGTNKLIFYSGKSLWQIDEISYKTTKLKCLNNQVIYNSVILNNNSLLVSCTNGVYIINNKLNIVKHVSYNQSNNLLEPFNAICKLNYPYVLLKNDRAKDVFLLNYITQSIKKYTLIDDNYNKSYQLFQSPTYDSINKKVYFANYTTTYCFNFISSFEDNKSIRIEKMNENSLMPNIMVCRNKLIQYGNAGMAIRDTDGKTFFYQNNNAINCLYQTQNEKIWLGTNNGLIVFDLRTPIINTINFDDRINYSFTSITKGADNNYYCLSQDLGLYKFDYTSKKLTLIDDKVRYNWKVTKIDNTIQACGGNYHLVEYNTISKQVAHPQFLLPFYRENTDLTLLIHHAKNKNIWYSLNGGVGLIKKDFKTNKLTNYSKFNDPPDFRIAHFNLSSEDSKGNIYFGSQKSNLVAIWNAQNNKFQEVNYAQLTLGEDNLQKGLQFLFVDSRENLWIAYFNGGLIKFNLITKKGIYYSINNGLPSDIVNEITEDNNNRIWFTTKKGLCCFLPENDKFLTFTIADGIPHNDLVENPLYYDQDRNLILCAFEHTVFSFNPSKLVSKYTIHNSKLFIDELIVNGKSFPLESNAKIFLKPNENNIEFNFSAIDFNRNNQLIFQYKITGISESWIDLGEKRSVTINNLASGSYHFFVRCKYKGNENWIICQTPCNFTIQTPWYKTWWFIICCVVAVLNFAWLLNRGYYLRKLDRQKAIIDKQMALEEERNRIARDMHDDLGSGLTKITYLSQMALKNEQNKVHLSSINKTSLELVENMSEIIWTMKEDNNSWEELFFYIKQYAQEYLSNNNIQVIFHFPEKITKAELSGEKRRNIFLAFKECLHNIIKHSKAKEATISVVQSENKIKINLKDNGIGFEKGIETKNGNGLKNIKSRMKAIGADAKFVIDNGTEVQLIIPI